MPLVLVPPQVSLERRVDMSINWATVYGNNNPIGQILNDLSLQQLEAIMTAPIQQQITSLNAEVQLDNSQESAWTTLKGDAAAVASDLNTLAQPATFQQLMASSSNPQVATAASDGSAQQGSYGITVTQLASGELLYGSNTNMPTPVTNPSAQLNLSGTFNIYIAGNNVTPNGITVTSSDSLNSIVNKINTSGAGVNASVLEQSNGQYIISIAGPVGQNNTITFSDGTNGPLYYLGLWNDTTSPGSLFPGEEVTAPQNASFYFGTNSSNPVTSSSNTVTNAIPGVTLTLQGTGQTTISVQPNMTAMVQTVAQFVNDWNTWVKDTQTLAWAYQPGTGISSTANNTSGYQSNSNQILTSPIPSMVLSEIGTQLVSWMGSSSNPYQSLADLGITFKTNPNGVNVSDELQLNQTTLENAINANPSAVASFFSQLVTNVSSLITGFSANTTGTASEAIASLSSQIAQANAEIAQQDQLLAQTQQNAITQYGQWVNSIASLATQDALLSAQFNLNSSSGSQGGL